MAQNDQEFHQGETRQAWAIPNRLHTFSSYAGLGGKDNLEVYRFSTRGSSLRFCAWQQ